MTRIFLLLVVIVAGSFASVVQGQEPQVRWDSVAYETFGGAMSRATACTQTTNSLGRAVVGDSQLPNGEFHAFLHDGVSMLDLGTFGGPSSRAESLNLWGQVVGFADAISAAGAVQPRAFIWDATTGLVDIGHLGGGRSWATGIDLYGTGICGTSETAAGNLHAFWRNPLSSTLVDCGTLGGTWSQGLAINGSLVVGKSGTSQGATRAFMWESSMGMVDLGTLGGSMSVASGISINGYICGWSQNSSGQVHPFVWDASSGMVDCGTLGGTWGFAMGVNNVRQVVGSAETASGDLHAFLWDSDTGVMFDLNDWIHPSLDWELQEANHITDSGFISGTGVHRGETRAFLLKPFRMSTLGSAGNNNTFTALHSDPGETIWFAWSLSRGSFQVPGFSGLELDLDSPTVVGKALDNGGAAVLSRWVPLRASGKTVYFQALSPQRYLVSPVFEKYFW